MADDVIIPDDLKGLAGKYDQAKESLREDIVIPDDVKELAGKYAPPPPPEKKPGLLERARVTLADAASRAPQPRPVGERRGGTAAEQRAGVYVAEEPAAPAETAPAPAAQPGPRRGGTRAEMPAPFVGGDERIPAPPPAPAGSILEQPVAGYQPSERDLIEQSKAPDTRLREAQDRRAPPEAKPFDTAQNLAQDVREATQNPVARGAVAGFSQLGTVGTGALRLAADLFGASGAADFAKGAGNIASTVGEGATKDLGGNDKLIADVTSSILNSVPAMAVGMAGGPALTTLFAQSTLSEYAAGRDAGFSTEESLARAGIMGFAEALGERFGFPEQIKLLKSVTKGLPSNEVAKVFGAMLSKEIPGEQLTTAVQFMADKMGPAALKSGATLDDYLKAAGDTLAVTIGQTAVMGGGPAAISTGREMTGRADAAVDRSAMPMAERMAVDAGFFAPKAEKPLPPTQARTQAIARFDELAAGFGLSEKAAAAVREQAATRPAGDVPGYLARAVAALGKRNLFKRPIDPDAVAELAGTLDGGQELTSSAAAAPESSIEPAAPSQTGGAETDDFSGLDTAPVLKGPVDELAHAAATSPTNDRPEPTEAQKEAGNYAKGHVRIGGLDIAIENPQGSMRRGVDSDGKAWESPMYAHYGYVKGTLAGDGDHSDVFVKPGTATDYTGPVFVIDQVDPKTGKFDEHKSVLGADTEAEALALYQANYADGWRGAAAVTQLPLQAFKSWVRDGTKRNPLGDISGYKPDVAVPAPVAAGPAAGRASEPGRSGGDVGPVAGADGTVPAPAAAPAPSGRPAAPAGAGNQPDATLSQVGKPPTLFSVGEKYTLDGKAYTVSKAADRAITLTDAKGKNRPVTADGPTWNELKRQAAAAPAPAPDPAAAAPTTMAARKEARGTARHPSTVMGSPLLADVSRIMGGLDPSMLTEYSHQVETKKTDKNGKARYEWRNPLIPGVGKLFRKGGSMDYGRVAEMLEDYGYLPKGTVEADHKGASEKAKEMIRAALNHDVVKTVDDQLADAQAAQDEERDAYYAEQGAEAAAELEAERQAIMAELDIDPAQVDEVDDGVVWEAAGSKDDAALMRALGFTEQEIADELGQTQGIASTQGGSQEVAGEGASADADRSPAAQPQGADEGLTTPTPEGLRAAEERASAADTADRREQKRLTDKAKADAELGEFTLTGSDRAVDVGAAAGQGGLFDAPETSQDPASDEMIYAMAGREWRIRLKRYDDGDITWAAEVKLANGFEAVPGNKVPLPVAKKAHAFQQEALAQAGRPATPAPEPAPAPPPRASALRAQKVPTAEAAAQAVDEQIAAVQALLGEAEAALPATADTKGAKQRLEQIAERLGVQVFKAAAGWHATGGGITIPDEDVDAQGAVSKDHVFAHELGHAIMQKRGMSFRGFPQSEMLKWVDNWPQWVEASKAFRPGIHDHENARIKRHAKKPDEIIADAIGSVLIGASPQSLVVGRVAGLTARDLGLDASPASQLKPEAAAPASVAAPQPERAAPTAGDTPMFSKAAPTEPFYSALARQIDGATMNAAPAGGWKGMLKNWITTGKVKADEVEWTGLNEWLDLQQGKVTKGAVSEYLNANGVQVQETVLGGAQRVEQRGRSWVVVAGDGTEQRFAREDEARANAEAGTGATKYGNYTLPGGTNYREVLLTLPAEKPKMAYRVSAAGGPVADLPDVVDFDTREQAEQELARRQAAQPRLFHSIMDFEKLPRDGGAQNYRSGHWDQPNVLAHIRLNDRTSLEPLTEQQQADLKAWTDAQAKMAEINDRLNKAQRESMIQRDIRLEELRNELRPQVRAGKMTPLELQRRLDEASTADPAVGKIAAERRALEAATPAKPVQKQYRTLFVEEIQSDYAQAARKGRKELAKSLAKRLGITEKEADKQLPQGAEFTGGLIPQDTGWTTVDTLDTFPTREQAQEWADKNPNSRPGEGMESRLEVQGAPGRGFTVYEQMRSRAAMAPNKGGVPKAPFVSATDAWVALALKRVIKMAVDEGYDRVAFVNGTQSAERYDLSKQISKVEWLTRPVSAKGTNSTPPDYGSIRAWDMSGNVVIDQQAQHGDLPDVIGKDLAEKLVNSDIARQTGSGKDVRELSGIDLKVGGEGMKAFYDKIVPGTAKDVLKKLGGQMRAVPLPLEVKDYERTSEYVGPDRTRDEVQQLYKLSQAHGGDIYANPITGAREPFAINRVTVEGDLRKLMSRMNDGMRFERAIVYPDISEYTAALFGGAIEHRQRPDDISQQPGFDITPAMRERAEGGLPLFRRDDATPMLGDKTAIQAAVDQLRQDWGNAPDVVVLSSVLDPAVPARIRMEYLRQIDQGGEGVPQAVFWQGKVYLFADVIPTESEAARAVFHEVLGHYGLQGAFGDALKPMLEQMIRLNREAVAKKAAEYGFDMSNPADARLAAEEVLAELAETRPTSTWVQRAIAAIRTWLRQHLPQWFGDTPMTDAELIRTFIAPARGFVERGREAESMDAQPAFLRRPAMPERPDRPEEEPERHQTHAEAEAILRASGYTVERNDRGAPQVLLNGKPVDYRDMKAGPVKDAWNTLTVDDPGEIDDLATPMFAKRKPSSHTPAEVEALARAGIGGPRSAKDKVGTYLNRALDLVRDRNALGQEIRQGALDQFHGIRQAVGREIGNLPVEQDPYIAARLANGGTSSVMRALLLHGQARWATNGQHLEKVPDTKGLLDVLAPLGDDLNDWFGWMIGNRAARLMKEGRENNFTDDQIKALQGLATPERKAAFQKAAIEYAAFKRSVLDVAQGAGLINPESRKAWDYADYVPFYRQIDEKAVFSATGAKGLAGQSSGIRTLKGGEAALNDPMENLLMNFSRLIDASLKNNAIRKTIDTLGETDAVAKVGYDMTSAYVPTGQVRKMLVENGTPDQVVDAIPEEVFDGIAKMWAIKAPSDPDVVRVMNGGKPEYYRVNDRLLLKALTSFVPFDFPGLSLMRGAKRLLTAAVTSTPEFMIRNWMRDSLASQAITRDGFNPAKSISGIAKSFREAGGFEHMLFAGASFQSGNVNAADPSGSAVAMRRALRAKGLSASSADAFMGTVVDTTARLWEHYREVGEAIENANREAVFEATQKRAGSVTAAAYEAKDMMDFSLRGSWAAYQLLADVLPFFNARVQGLYRLGRADPKRLAVVGTLIMAASLMLGMANDGEDWYEELPDWDKDTFWHFRIGGKHFRVPKPFEIGVMFGTLPERIGRSIKGLDSGKKTVSRAWSNVRDQLAFDPVPQLIRPALNVWANQDTFRDSPIEGMADEGKLPSQRANARTSATMTHLSQDVLSPLSRPAQALGVADEAFGMGPKRLEYLVGGYLGTVGLYALGAADMLVHRLEGRPPGPSLRADDLPVVRAFYREDPARATVFESDLYKMRTEVEQIYHTLTALAKDGKRREAVALLEQEREKLAVRGAVVGATKALNELNKLRDRIYADPDLTPDQKRDRVDEIQRKKNEIARKVATDPRVKAAM